MKRMLVISIFLITICYSGKSQNGLFPLFEADTTNPFPKFYNRLYTGGNIGFWAGNPTYINVSPILGIHVSKYFSVGGTFTYNYYQQKYQNMKYTSYIIGGGAFARYRILESVFLQAGWDRLSVIDPNSILNNSRVWVDNLLVGGGYRQSFSDKGSFVIMVFWNINDTPLSPYPNPIIQTGFNIYF